MGTYFVPRHWARHFQSYLIAQLLEVGISTPISTQDHSQDGLVPKFLCSALRCLYRTLRTLKFVEVSGHLFKDPVSLPLAWGHLVTVMNLGVFAWCSLNRISTLSALPEVVHKKTHSYQFITAPYHRPTNPDFRNLAFPPT